MANTLTNLIPDLYEALDVVSRELTGFIPAISTDNSVDRVGLDQDVVIPLTPAASSATNTPAVAPPDTGDQTIGNETITIDTSKHVPIRWNGEQTKAYGHTGQFSSTMAQQFAQAMRTLANEIEADIAGEYFRASRAVGVAGTTPFGSNLDVAAQAKQILDDNGAPPGDRHMILNTSAGVNLRTLANLNQANTAGTTETLRRGILLPLFGLDVRESAQIQSHTKGTATGFDCTAIEPVGETTVACDGSDSGTVLAGDIVTTDNAADANKYVVLSGSTLTTNASGNFIVGKNGMRVVTVVADEWTIGANYTANMFFQRSAIHLATRMPAAPQGGDLAVDSFVVTDPVSGLSFEAALYEQFLQNVIHIRIAWGTKLIKPEHTGLLLG